MVAITSSRVISVQAKRSPNVQIQGLSLNIGFDNIKFENGKLVVTFTYNVNYDKNAGNITVTGELFVEDPSIKKVEEEFKKTKILPVEIAEEIVTAASFTGGAAGTLMAYALSLPAPINVPKARLSPQPTAKGAS